MLKWICNELGVVDRLKDEMVKPFNLMWVISQVGIECHVPCS